MGSDTTRAISSDSSRPPWNLRSCGMTWEILSASICVGFSFNVNRRAVLKAVLFLTFSAVSLLAAHVGGLSGQMKGTAGAPDLTEARQIVNRYRAVHGDTPE